MLAKYISLEAVGSQTEMLQCLRLRSPVSCPLKGKGRQQHGPQDGATARKKNGFLKTYN